jgi:hypothetical protein
VPVGQLPGERAGVVAARLGDRQGGRDAQALGPELPSLPEADDQHPSIATRPKERQLAKGGAHVFGALNRPQGLWKLLTLEHPHGLEVGLDLAQWLACHLHAHGRRV